jgi:hypothetical protein
MERACDRNPSRSCQAGTIVSRLHLLMLLTCMTLSILPWSQSQAAEPQTKTSTVADLLPSEDAYVQSTLSGTNFGGDGNLYVGDANYNDPIARCRSFLKFDLSSLPADAIVLDAEVRLNAWGTGPAPDIVVGAHYLASDAWSETTITWGNAPTSFVATACDFQTLDSPGSYAWNVAASVRLALFQDGVFSVVLKEPTEGTDHNWCGMMSKEGTAAYRPRLHVEYLTDVTEVVVEPDGSGDLPTIQDAIDAVHEGMTVSLANGTFTGTGNRDLTYRGKLITVRSLGGDPENCVIDCQGSAADQHRGVYFHGGEGPGAILRGVTIVNGYATTGLFPYQGGGILVEAAYTRPTIDGCLITGCYSQAGGGIYLHGYGAVITGCTFRDNSSDNGAAIHCHQQADVLISGCLFHDNHSANFWGAIGLHNTPAVITSCTLARNSSPTCAGIGLLNCNPVISNTIIAGGVEGKAVHCEGGTENPVLSCCDFYGNAGGDWVERIADRLGLDGNLCASPRFCAPEMDDFSVDEFSPCSEPYSPGDCGQIGALGIGCTSISDVEDAPAQPLRTVLHTNQPNPFNPATVIRYDLAEAGPVRLRIFDGQGRLIRLLVAEPSAQPGRHEVRWDGLDDAGRRTAAGVYLYRLDAGSGHATGKMTMIK